MPLDCNLYAGECIFELGLSEALDHKWLESQRFGEDLGLLPVRAWCLRHWQTFQRFRRIEHLFGERMIKQFPAAEFGIWRGYARTEGTPFDLVLGAFECCMENLEFVEWARGMRLANDDSYSFFTALDPNCVRMDYDPIIERAEQLVAA